MPFARAFASLVAALGGNVAAQTCTTFAVDIAERTSASSDRLRVSIGRSLMASIAVSLQPKSCPACFVDIHAFRSQVMLALLRHDRPSVDSGTEARSCSCTVADSRPHRTQTDVDDVQPRVRPRATHPQ
jgi:hypothetical protein